jgi:hypothetical protein
MQPRPPGRVTAKTAAVQPATEPARPGRFWWLAAVPLLFFLLAALSWRSQQPSVTYLPGEPTRPAGAAGSSEAPSSVARPPTEPPPAKRWPRLAAGLELLERNRGAEAASFFAAELASGGLQGDQAGMALYFQADALFSQGRYSDAAPLYRTFLEGHGALPAADNARSALEYIAGAARHLEAINAKGKL